MATIFSRIISGEIPSYRVAEDEHYYAFLDIHPLTEGHTLVVPKKEVDYVFDLEAEDLCGLMAFAQQVARHIEASIPCQRVGVAVIGLDVPHAHVHLVPINKGEDMNFGNPKLELTEGQFREIQEKIRF